MQTAAGGKPYYDFHHDHCLVSNMTPRFLRKRTLPRLQAAAAAAALFVAASASGRQTSFESFTVTEIPLPSDDVVSGFTDTFGRNSDGDVYIGVLLGESELRAAYRANGGSWKVSSVQIVPRFIGPTGTVVGERPNGQDGIVWFPDRTGNDSALAFQNLLPVGIDGEDRILLVQDTGDPLFYFNGALHQINPAVYAVDWDQFKPVGYHANKRIDGYYIHGDGQRYAASIAPNEALQVDWDSALTSYQALAYQHSTPGGSGVSRVNASSSLLFGPAFPSKTIVSNFLAHSLNDSGIAVGTAAFPEADPPEQPRAALWESSLGTLQIDALLPEGSPDRLLYARSIDDSPVFLALGVDGNGNEHLYSIQAEVAYRDVSLSLEREGVQLVLKGSWDFPASAIAIESSPDAVAWQPYLAVPLSSPEQRQFSIPLEEDPSSTQFLRAVGTPAP